MKPRDLRRWLSFGRPLVGLLLAALLSGCGSLSSGFLLNPAGPVAWAEHREFMLVGLILGFVWVPVLLLVPLIAWHYRITNKDTAFRPQWGFSPILEILIWIPPVAVVGVLAFFLVHYTLALDPYRPLSTGKSPPLVVQVVALDWKWLFLYPAQHVATVNEVFIPAGRPVHFYLTSGTVMQSLLMPRLAGQIFAMNGMRTQLNFAASSPGAYLGENTQYNGDGFAADKFIVHALPPDDFNRWVAQAQAQPAVLDDKTFLKLSKRSVLKTPLQFGRFALDLFTRILSRRITPGYLAQHHEAGDHA